MHEPQILETAIAAFQQTTGLNAKVLAHEPMTATVQPDALVEIEADQRTHHFLAEVKAVDRFVTPAQVKAQTTKWPEPVILVAPYITRETAQRCRELKLPFMDTAGNTYIEAPNLLVYVVGQQRPLELRKDRYRALNPAGLQITFALLCRPELIRTNYRRIRTEAKVALGTVGPAIKDLEARGFIRFTEGGTGRLIDPTRLVDEWLTHYHTTLRPKLNQRRFEADPAALTKMDLRPHKAYWGGEVAADKLTHMLQPAIFTIYARGPITELIAATRMRARPEGNVEILEVFWNFPADEGTPDVVPPLLVYADLLATQHGRNLEVAKIINEQHIKPRFNQTY